MSVTWPPPIFGFENLYLIESEVVSCGILLIRMPLVRGANSMEIEDPSNLAGFSLVKLLSSSEESSSTWNVVRVET